MKMPVLLAVLAVAVLAAPVLAEDDAESRFHEAYLLEVVEGKVAEAAKIYFDLAESDETPPKIRREAEFRFAVTCVLLGRADEARARFAGMLADPDLPDGLRARVTEYRKAVEGIGIGTELDKKLESLVFELGRAPLSGQGNSYFSPPVYRDFRIIGKPAVPLLKKLLAHPDSTLRIHAFRLLLLMKEPGMVEIWEPDSYRSSSLAWDLVRYAGEDRALWKKVEEKLLAEDGDQYNHPVAVFAQDYRSFSAGFVRELAQREGMGGLAFRIASRSGFCGEPVALLTDWLRSDDAELRFDVANHITGWYHSGGEPPAGEDVFRRVTEEISGAFLHWWGKYPSNRPSLNTPDETGYFAFAQTMPVPVLLELFAAEVEKGLTFEGNILANPIAAGLTGALADAIDKKELTDVQARAYLDTLEKWFELAADPAWEKKLANRRPSLGNARFHEHFQHALRGLSAEEAAQSAAALVGRHPSFWGYAFRDFTCRVPGDVRIVAEAVLAVSRGSRKDMMRYFPYFGNYPHQDFPEGVASEVAKTLPALIPFIHEQQLPDAAQKLGYFARQVSHEEATELLLAFAKAGNSLSQNANRDLLTLLVHATGSNAPEHILRFRREVVVPALPRIYETVDAEYRKHVLVVAVALLHMDITGYGKLGEAREPLAAFLRKHLAELDAHGFRTIAGAPELIPPEEWVPVADPSVFSDRHVHNAMMGAVADATAVKLVGDGASVNEAVLDFLRTVVGKETATMLVERILRNGDAESMALVAKWFFYPNSPLISREALEAGLARGLGRDPADLVMLAELGRRLAKEHPSEKLFPVIEKLVASEDLGLLRIGIGLAESLGREEMIPHLIEKLDSMDANLRSEAKAAIDAILEVKRSREEAERRFKDPEKTE